MDIGTTWCTQLGHISITFGNTYSCRKKYIFQFPLPISPPIEPSATFANDTTGEIIDFFQIDSQDFEKEVYPNLGKAALTGYNAMAWPQGLHCT